MNMRMIVQGSAAVIASMALAAGVVACGSHSSSSDKPGGSGHISISGTMSLDRDFAVAQCTISPPGQGLITGYQMIANSDERVDMASIKVPEYTKDDTYNLGQRSEEQQLAGAMRAQMGPIMLAFNGAQPDQKTQLAETPQSHITITISNNGAHGEAKFDNFQEPMAALNEKVAAMGASVGASPSAAPTDSSSPAALASESPSIAASPSAAAPLESPSPAASDLPASGASPSTKFASGTITWNCEVKHLNAGPVNEMFKKLIPH